jgi:hypothetical protein
MNNLQLFRKILGDAGAVKAVRIIADGQLHRLEDGSSLKVSDIKSIVEERPSISWRSVERAGTALKVVRQRTNTFPSETYWCLPPISPHLVNQSPACA